MVLKDSHYNSRETISIISVFPAIPTILHCNILDECIYCPEAVHCKVFTSIYYCLIKPNHYYLVWQGCSLHLRICGSGFVKYLHFLLSTRLIFLFIIFVQETVVFLSPSKKKKVCEETENIQIFNIQIYRYSYFIYDLAKRTSKQCKKFKASREPERNPTVYRGHYEFLTQLFVYHHIKSFSALLLQVVIGQTLTLIGIIFFLNY